MIVSPQPAIVPVSPPWSSKTYRFQVPFGFVPLKTDSRLVPVGVGAGGGKTSLQQPVA